MIHSADGPVRGEAGEGAGLVGLGAGDVDEAVEQLTVAEGLAMDDRGLRITGLISMVIGALIITVTASFY